MASKETSEALVMLTGTSDVLGRLSHGLDMDEFDARWPRRSDETGPEGEGGDQLDQWGGTPDSYAEGLEHDTTPYGERTTYDDGSVDGDTTIIHGDAGGRAILGDDEPPAEFETPVEVFPVFKAALQHFQAQEPQQGIVRIDTEKTYQGFVAEKAVKEIQRRLNELRAVVEAHVADMHGGKLDPKVAPMRKWDDIIGAAEAVKTVQTLKSAETAADAAKALPQVELDLPDFAQGKVGCWKDGGHIVVSLHFADANGDHRVATMASKPNVTVDEVADEVEGMSPMEVLGALPRLASKITGEKLVCEVAGVALRSRRNNDVLGMSDEPLVRVNGLEESRAPLAALMYVQQQAEAGDAQAAAELAIMKAAAQTPTGKKIAAPMLEASTQLLAAGRREKGGR